MQALIVQLQTDSTHLTATLDIIIRNLTAMRNELLAHDAGVKPGAAANTDGGGSE
jgi:hypothetical protein